MTLKHIRLKSGLKINHIAEQLEISRVQYRNYELGIHKPPLRRMDMLARIFGISYEELEKAWEEGKRCHHYRS